MMKHSEIKRNIPLSTTVTVLVGFPIFATLISLLLLNRSLITDIGLDFFNTFWIIITGWYILQLFIISRILVSSGWDWKDIGYTLSKKKTVYLIAGYLIFAFGLLGFIEMALANSTVDISGLDSLPSLTPKTTTARVIFIMMGLFTGLAEEIVYRGFAISALQSKNINKWLAVFISAIPFIFQHGLKSIEQFWWFLSWGLIFGILFILLKKLTLNIIIHWLVILSAMLAVLQVIQ